MPPPSWDIHSLPGEARQHVVELREFDLELAFFVRA